MIFSHTDTFYNANRVSPFFPLSYLHNLMLYSILSTKNKTRARRLAQKFYFYLYHYVYEPSRVYVFIYLSIGICKGTADRLERICNYIICSGIYSNSIFCSCYITNKCVCLAYDIPMQFYCLCAITSKLNLSNLYD